MYVILCFLTMYSKAKLPRVKYIVDFKECDLFIDNFFKKFRYTWQVRNLKCTCMLRLYEREIEHKLQPEGDEGKR